MSDPFLGEIKVVSFGFAPKGWAECNGQLLSINQNQALFSLLGTMYGGNGQTNFALPDLRTKTAIHVGPSHSQGQTAGEQAHSLTLNELPAHTHAVAATTDAATQPTPVGALLAATDGVTFGTAYGPGGVLGTMAPGAVGNAGGSQPHNNMQPHLTLTFVIALQGIFPSRN